MLKLIKNNVLDLPTNLSLSYLWCGGFGIFFFLLVQMISGFILSLLYVSDSSVSFGCVLEITNESLFGWVIRYLHIWGVSFIFVLILGHMGRALYYSSYSKKGVWNVGCLLYILMMVEAFLGYVLPWHQMSYWAATVLTSILRAIPFLGDPLYQYVVGGFSVTNSTLVRVFSAHVSLSFIILGFSVLHLFYLHLSGSNDPLFSGSGYSDYVFFNSYFVSKDGLFVLGLSSLLFFCIWVLPDMVLDVESFIEADPLVTPLSIKPEWYFLGYYAMLRSIGSKLGGLILVLAFLVVLWYPSFNLSCVYSLGRQLVFWLLGGVWLGLSVLGACHPELPYIFISLFLSFFMLLLITCFKAGWLGETGLSFMVIIWDSCGFGRN